jgi:Holliday junction resolvase RusA-like endonuclease
MMIQIKPLSVNQVWQGKRFKTKAYKQYERDLIMLLPRVKIDFKKPLKIGLTFGFSNKASDIDNPTKPILDILQKKYGFDDKQVQELNLKKELVTKGNEFIKLDIKEI